MTSVTTNHIGKEVFWLFIFELKGILFVSSNFGDLHSCSLA